MSESLSGTEYLANYNLRRFTPKTKILLSLVRDHLYVGGCELDARINQPVHGATLAFL